VHTVLSNETIKYKLIKYHRLIQENPIIRIIVAPIWIPKRYLEMRRYCKSKDSLYLKSLYKKYSGKRCFIIGNGPSLTSKDLDLIKNEISFGSNRIFNMFNNTLWRPTFYFCIDRQNIIDDIETIKKLKIPYKFLSLSAKKYGRNRKDNIRYLLLYGRYSIRVEKRFHGYGTVQEDISKYVSTTQSVTCTMIEMAFYMGFREIYLLGVDHSFPITIDSKGKKNFDYTIEGHFKDGGFKDSSIDVAHYDALTDSYKVLQTYAIDHGIEIYNATRGGKLEVYKRTNLEDIINL